MCHNLPACLCACTCVTFKQYDDFVIGKISLKITLVYQYTQDMKISHSAVIQYALIAKFEVI